MNEVTGHCWPRLAFAKEANLVADAAIAEMSSAQPGFDAFGESQRLDEAAGGLDHAADHRALMDIEPAFGEILEEAAVR